MSNDTNETDSLPYSIPTTVIVGSLTAICSLCTVGGNLLVIAAFFIERTLRTPTNYFIASLAVTDLLIGVFSMNFYTLYILLGKWPLGELICDLWLSLDYAACLTSQYTVFFITVDRYCSVRIPAKYRNWRTDRRVIYMVAATWIFPCGIFFTTIMGWPYFTDPTKRRSVTVCYAEFVSSPIFNTVLTICYFWITLLVMFVLYAGIYHVALNLQKKSDEKRRKMTSLVSMAGQTMSRIGVGVTKTNDDDNDMGGDSDDDDDDDDDDNNSSSIRNQNAPNNDNKSKSQLITDSKQENCSSNRKNNTYSAGKKQAIVRYKPERDERSSSPVLPSDSEVNITPEPSLKQVGVNRNLKASRYPESTKLYKIESPILIEMPSSPTNEYSSPLDKSNTVENGTAVTNLISPLKRLDKNPTPTTSNDSDYHTASGPSSDMGEVHTHLLHNSTQHSSAYPEITERHCSRPQIISLNSNPERLEGLRYIDQDSLKSLPSTDNVKLLLELFSDSSGMEDSFALTFAPDAHSSPVWKRRPYIEEDYDENFDDATEALLQQSEGAYHHPCYNQNNNLQKRDTAAIEDDDNNDSMDFSTTNQISKCSHYDACNQFERKSDRSRREKSDSIINEDASQRLKAMASSSKRYFMRLANPVRNLTHRIRNKTKREKIERGRSENRARKALRTISLILGAFVLCWTPYHVLILIKGFCDDDEYTCVNDNLYILSYWLCYINSPINPFCYALANAQFKKAFIRILRCDLHRT